MKGEIAALEILLYKEVLQKQEEFQAAFKEKYGEDFQDVLVNYCIFVLNPKRCNFTSGHRIVMPIVTFTRTDHPYGYFSYVKYTELKYGISWGYIEGYSGVTFVSEEYYEEVLPTEKVKEAYECIGVTGELISAKRDKLIHGN